MISLTAVRRARLLRPRAFQMRNCSLFMKNSEATGHTRRLDLAGRRRGAPPETPREQLPHGLSLRAGQRLPEGLAKLLGAGIVRHHRRRRVRRRSPLPQHHLLRLDLRLGVPTVSEGRNAHATAWDQGRETRRAGVALTSASCRGRRREPMKSLSVGMSFSSRGDDTPSFPATPATCHRWRRPRERHR